MNHEIQQLRDLRRKGAVKDYQKLSELALQLTPESKLLEETLLKLDQRENPADVLRKFKKEIKRYNITDDDDKATVLLIEAIARNRLGQSQEALSILRRAKVLDQNRISATLEVDIYLEEARIYSWQGDSETAINQYLLALNLSQTHHDDVGMALTWAAIGRLYLEVLASQRALYYLESAFSLISLWDTSRERIRLIKDIADVLYSLDKPEKALKTIESITPEELNKQDNYLQFIILGTQLQCTKRCKSDHNILAKIREKFLDKCDESDDYQIAHRDFIIGCLETSHQNEKALSLLNSAFDYYQINQLMVPAWKSLLLMTEAHFYLNEYDNSVRCLEKAMELAIDMRSPLLHEKTLMLQKEFNLPSIIEAEQLTTISNSAKSSDNGYRILKTLGNGAFGMVYHAYDALRDQDVALKKFNLTRIYDTRRREAVLDNIRRELKATSQIHHPGILKPIAYGNDIAGEPYVVMPLIKGQAIRQWMQNTQELNTLLSLLRDVFFALASAHEANVIHRDLKPENIMLTDSGQPVIVDFGISCFEPNEYDPAAATGTLPYMSPEHHRGASANAAMDIFAMGVLSYELIIGERPWLDRCPNNIFSYQFKQYQIKSELNKKNIPQDIVKLILSMFKRKAVARPKAEDLAFQFDILVK